MVDRSGAAAHPARLEPVMGGPLAARLRSGGSTDPDADGTADLTALLTRGSRQRNQALASRIETVLTTLGGPVPTSSGRTLLTALDRALRLGGANEAWLSLAVLTGRLPKTADVRRLVRASRLGNSLPALLAGLQAGGLLESTDWPAVEVVRDQVLVDVHDTARNPFATGIQRVARQATRRWARDHDVVLIGWTDGYTAYRRLTPVETEAALNGRTRTGTDSPPDDSTVLVPWRCIHLVPELPAELEQAPRYQAFASLLRLADRTHRFRLRPDHGRRDDGAEGCPSFSPDTWPPPRQVDRIATISEAAAIEYRGWRTMLAGAGQAGPDIRCVPLPVQATVPSATALAQARDLLAIGSLPVVLCRRQPRAPQEPPGPAPRRRGALARRAGLQPGLRGRQLLEQRPVRSPGQKPCAKPTGPCKPSSALPDELLWAAYRLAYCTVFPSLHEGFGLPVAESLASGTPVITSNFGSMADIASQGGALLVDPRDDETLTDALRQLLTDRALRDRLAAQAATIPPAPGTSTPPRPGPTSSTGRPRPPLLSPAALAAGHLPARRRQVSPAQRSPEAVVRAASRAADESMSPILHRPPRATTPPSSRKAPRSTSNRRTSVRTS